MQMRHGQVGGGVGWRAALSTSDKVNSKEAAVKKSDLDVPMMLQQNTREQSCWAILGGVGRTRRGAENVTTLLTYKKT